MKPKNRSWPIRRRLLRRFWIWNAALAFSAAIFLLLPRVVKILPPMTCFVHDVLHLYCPFCGGTRAVWALLGGHLKSAFLLYPPLLPGIAAVLAAEVLAFRRAWRGREPLVEIPTYLPWVCLALLILFTVGRDLLLVFGGVDTIGDLIGFWR